MPEKLESYSSQWKYHMDLVYCRKNWFLIKEDFIQSTRSIIIDKKDNVNKGITLNSPFSFYFKYLQSPEKMVQQIIYRNDLFYVLKICPTNYLRHERLIRFYSKCIGLN